MSKLFETLEQIRRNEAEAKKPPSPPPAPSRPKKVRPASRRRKLLVATGLLGAAAVALALWRPAQLTVLFMRSQAFVSQLREQTSGPQQEHATPRQATPQAEPAQPAGQPIKVATANPEVIRLNNQAAGLVERGQYWPAISLLNQAIRLDPERPEPLINMGVALAELGLYGPATRYLLKAQEIAPGIAKLDENLSLLHRAGLIEATK